MISLWFMNYQILRNKWKVNMFCKLTTGPEKSKQLKIKQYLTLQVNSHEAVLGQPISVDILPMSLTSWRLGCLNIWTSNQTWQSKHFCVWILWAPSTQSSTSQDYVMNTHTMLSFPTFLGLPQLIQSRNSKYILSKLTEEIASPPSSWC